MSYFTQYNKYVDLVEKKLDEILTAKAFSEQRLFESMSYSIKAGGKRLRPVLSLAVCEMLGGDKEVVLPFAAAIELIHTYSLIHDDLPCMDDDDYRRGKPTNHKVFGEAMAVLAGDALLNLAFEVMFSEIVKDNGLMNQRAKASLMIAKASGGQGMIGGQVIDMESEGGDISFDRLKTMHRKKTGALIKASILVPAILLDQNEETKIRLEAYAENIGLAFQIKDDILDSVGNSAIVGKPTGSDAKNKKSTFVTMLGLDRARERLKNTTEHAVEAIKSLKGSDFLIKTAAYIEEREK